MKKIESGVFKIYFRGHKEHQGHIEQNLSGVFFLRHTRGGEECAFFIRVL